VTSLAVPAKFARLTTHREGAAGRAWLADLPDLVSASLDRWSCAPDGAVTHGQVGLVLPVRRADGTSAVLKVSFPHPGNVDAPAALAAWAGRGAVRLYERDDASFAVLLERAEPGSSLADLADIDAAVAVAGALARRLAVPAPAGLPRLSAEVASWPADLRAEQAALGDPLPRGVLSAAVAAAHDLGPDQPDTVVHGDLHYTNVLRATREPWLAVDPRGWVGDPAYDAVTLLRSRNAELLAGTDVRGALLRRLAVFAEAAGLDRARARRWSQLRATQAALWGRRYADPPEVLAASETIATLLA
jgi:streptomycin 6-kinase